MTPSEQAMQQKTASWYNFLATALNLDPQTFQLVQASMPLGATSVPLFQMADSIPPNSVNFYFDSSQWNRFSSDYQQMLEALLDPTSNQLQQILGDQYAAWNTYKINFFTQNPTTTKTVAQVFDTWANTLSPLPPNTISQAEAVLASQGISPLLTARQNFANQAYYLQGQPMYNQAIADIQAAIVRGESATINFNSATSSSDVSHTWAEGGLGGLFDFFEGEGGAEYEAINQKASAANVLITGTISKMVSVPIGPGAWFTPGVFNNAYQNKDNNYVWDPASQTTWETCFGSNGSMQRVIGSLVVIDGVDITITSQASYSSSDYTSIKTEAEVGFWPFFFAEEDSTVTHTVTLNNDASLSVRIQSNIGNPKILGVNVLSAATAFGGGNQSSATVAVPQAKAAAATA